MDNLESISRLFGFGAEKALQPPRYAKVTAISGDSVTVLLGTATVEAVRCCLCNVGDVVLLETLPNGTLAAVATKGIQPATGQDTTYTISGSVSDHAYTTTLTGSDGSTDTATLQLAAGANVTLTDGTGTVTIAAKDTTYSNATTTTAGLMSAADKAKLDGITESADAVSVTQSLTSGTKVGTVTVNGTGTDLYAPTPPTVDSALSSTSTNPVQNKAIVTALATKQDTITAGDGLSKSGSTLAVNSTVVRTSGNQTISGNKTFTGVTTITDTSKFSVTRPSGAVVSGEVMLRVVDNPFAYGWHDLLAFNRIATPTMETTTDGTTWASATLNSRPFYHNDYYVSSTRVVEATGTIGTRWTWTTNGFCYSNAAYLCVGLTTNNSANNQFVVTLEYSTDSGSSWTVAASAAPLVAQRYNFIPLTSWPYVITNVRLSFTKDASDTTHFLDITTIRLFTPRCAGQGRGQENDLIYTWDNSLNAKFPALVQANTSYYGTCSTAAGTAAKVVTCSGFVLATGARVHVYCGTANTVSGYIALNVNNTGAKAVLRGNTSTSSKPVLWGAGTVQTFVYTGNYWEWEGSDMVEEWQLPSSVFTEANPPAFSDLTGTATPAQLPIATDSAIGAVKVGDGLDVDTAGVLSAPEATYQSAGIIQPDNDTIVINNGILTATGNAGADVIWQNRGGFTYTQVLAAAQANSGGGVGWREEKHSNGILDLWIWDWASVSAGSTATHTVSWPSAATPFVTKPDEPIIDLDFRVATGTNSAVSTAITAATVNSSVTWSRYGTNAASRGVVLLHAHGWWYNIDPPAEDDYVANNAVGDAVFSYNGVTYYPVTAWTVSDTGAGGDARICAAVRFLMSEDSQSGQNHILAQYAAYTKTGLAPTNNGYMLIRRLGSAITSYVADTGQLARGTFFSTLNNNQRQGYCSNAEASGNLLWGDMPYIIRDLGAGIAANTTVTATTFYVGTTESGYPQTSISATYTTPKAD